MSPTRTSRRRSRESSEKNDRLIERLSSRSSRVGEALTPYWWPRTFRPLSLARASACSISSSEC
jgi:hypothetical protein